MQSTRCRGPGSKTFADRSVNVLLPGPLHLVLCTLPALLAPQSWAIQSRVPPPVARDFRGDSFIILSPRQCPISASWFFLGSQNETLVYANSSKIPSKTLAGQRLIGGSPGPGQIARNVSWEHLSIDEDLWNSVLDERNVTSHTWRVNLDASQVQVGKPFERDFEGIHAANKLKLPY